MEPILVDEAPVRLRHWEAHRVAAVGGADDGPAQMGDPRHALAVERKQAAMRVAFGHEQAVEAVADAETFPPALGGRERHGTNDGIEPRRIAPSGADRDAPDRLVRHASSSMSVHAAGVRRIAGENTLSESPGAVRSYAP